MAPAPTTWRATLTRALELLCLAETYAEDGAYRTAAERAEAAAGLFRQAEEERSRHIDQSARSFPR